MMIFDGQTQYLRSALFAEISTSASTSPITSIEAVFQYLGPIISIIIQLYMINVAIKISKNKSSEGISSFPFAALLVNSLVWTPYALLRHDAMLLYPCMSGIVVSIICMSVHKYYNNIQSQIYRDYMMVGVFSMLAAMMYSYQQIHGLGMLGSISSILLVSSPVATLHQVYSYIEEDKLANMIVPFRITVVMWMYSLSWLTYGAVVARDPFIYGPSILGLMTSTAELLVCVLISSAQKL